MQAQSIAFDLNFTTIIGVYDEERISSQPLTIYGEIFVDDQSKIAPDTIEDIIRTWLSSKQPFLLESMAYNLACSLLQTVTSAKSVALAIQKPQAIKKARFVEVAIKMERTPRR